MREKGTWVEWDRFWTETRHRARLTRKYNCNYLKGSKMISYKSVSGGLVWGVINDRLGHYQQSKVQCPTSTAQISYLLYVF